MPSSVLSTEITDPVNARILAVCEDRIAGFHEDPFAEIARLSGMPLEIVLERLRAMLEAGVIRRIRQTLMATNLAPGALVAWQVPTERLDAAFDYLAAEDPFSGHVVIRSTDAETPGSAYRLWTTLKVPQGFSMQQHCELPRRTHRRAGVPDHAGEAPVRARRRPRAAARHGARQPLRRAGRGARHQHRRARRAGVARARARSSASSTPTRCVPSRGARAPRKRASRTTSSCASRAVCRSDGSSAASRPSSST